MRPVKQNSMRVLWNSKFDDQSSDGGKRDPYPYHSSDLFCLGSGSVMWRIQVCMKSPIDSDREVHTSDNERK